MVGRWFAEQINTHGANTSSADNHGVPAQRILIFNQQTRDANALAHALHNTLVRALGGEKPFSHAIFCTNTPFKYPGSSTPDLLNLMVNHEDVQELRVQKALATTWRQIDPETNVTVVPTVEEAVAIVRAMGKTAQTIGSPEPSSAEEKSTRQVTALVTGSLQLVGGLLDVLESKPVSPPISETKQ